MQNLSLKKCKCGFSMNDPKVEAKTVYSSWGWFLFTILGMSAKPKMVNYVCSVCGEKISSISDLEILKKFIGR